MDSVTDVGFSGKEEGGRLAEFLNFRIIALLQIPKLTSPRTSATMHRQSERKKQ